MKGIPIVTIEEKEGDQFLLRFADGEECIIPWKLIGYEYQDKDLTIKQIAMVIRIGIIEAARIRNNLDPLL